jgi:hypothetical protein
MTDTFGRERGGRGLIPTRHLPKGQRGSLRLVERLGAITSFAVLEPVEIRRLSRSRQILATNTDEGSCEIGSSRRGGLVRQDTCVERTGETGPFAAFDTIREIKALEINFHSQTQWRPGRNRDRRAEKIRLNLVWQTGHDSDVLTDHFIMRDIQVVKFTAVVVTDQSSHLLEPIRLELHQRPGTEAMRLLAPRHE